MPIGWYFEAATNVSWTLQCFPRAVAQTAEFQSAQIWSRLLKLKPMETRLNHLTDMHVRFLRFLAFATLIGVLAPLSAQQPAPQGAGRPGVSVPGAPKPEDTEVWEPVPKMVTAATTPMAPPSDAIVLFDGQNLDQWVSSRDKSPAKWTVAGGVVTVNKARSAGNIETKRSFRNYQLHIEWKIPVNIAGAGQDRGNSGIFLVSTGPGDAGYELQILDSYNNKTYVNGQAGSIYKQAIPLVNPSRKPGEWQTYDVVWSAPVFNENGSLKTPAYVTVFFNGVLVQNHFEVKGETRYIGQPSYKKFDRAPIKLQAHSDPSEPISFRNIWIREL